MRTQHTEPCLRIHQLKHGLFGNDRQRQNLCESKTDPTRIFVLSVNVAIAAAQVIKDVPCPNASSQICLLKFIQKQLSKL